MITMVMLVTMSNDLMKHVSPWLVLAQTSTSALCTVWLQPTTYEGDDDGDDHKQLHQGIYIAMHGSRVA